MMDSNPGGMIVSYKVVGGVLIRALPEIWIEGLGAYADGFEEQFLMAMWLFGLPDMEFAVSYQDCSPGSPMAPLLAMCIDRRRPHAGYAIPMHLHWREAMSVPQLQEYVACMKSAYPINEKVRALAIHLL